MLVSLQQVLIGTSLNPKTSQCEIMEAMSVDYPVKLQTKILEEKANPLNFILFRCFGSYHTVCSCRLSLASCHKTVERVIVLHNLSEYSFTLSIELVLIVYP